MKAGSVRLNISLPASLVVQINDWEAAHAPVNLSALIARLLTQWLDDQKETQ